MPELALPGAHRAQDVPLPSTSRSDPSRTLRRRFEPEAEPERRFAPGSPLSGELRPHLGWTAGIGAGPKPALCPGMYSWTSQSSSSGTASRAALRCAIRRSPPRCARWLSAVPRARSGSLGPRQAMASERSLGGFAFGSAEDPGPQPKHRLLDRSRPSPSPRGESPVQRRHATQWARQECRVRSHRTADQQIGAREQRVLGAHSPVTARCDSDGGERS